MAENMCAYLGKYATVSTNTSVKNSDLSSSINTGTITECDEKAAIGMKACIYGVHFPIEKFSGKIIAVITRKGSTFLVVSPRMMTAYEPQIIASLGLPAHENDRTVSCLNEKSCGVIPYTVNNGNIEFLLLFQSLSKTWSFPKGHIELHETEKETALRELKEETGLKGKLIDGFREEINYQIAQSTYKKVVLFLANTDKDVSMQETEISHYIWADEATVIKKLRNRNTPILLKKAKECITTSTTWQR